MQKGPPATTAFVGCSVAGDYNCNAVVDAPDYIVWRDTLGSMTNLAVDVNGSSVIDVGDYDLWKQNFGHTSGAVSGNGVAVPESETLVMLFLAAVGWFLRRCGFASRCQTTCEDESVAF